MLTFVLEYSVLLPEFYIIGVLHEIGRQTVYYNSNVNSPVVGDLVSVLYFFFYLARVAGMIFGLLFALSRNYNEITYYLGVPMCVALFLAGWFRGVFWLLFTRVMLGFFSSYAPVQCILRKECDRTQVAQQKADYLEEEKDGEGWKRVSGMKTVLKRVLEFSFSFLAMMLAGWLYNKKKLSLWRPSWMISIGMSGIFVWFFLLWRCREPQYIPARWSDNQEDEEAYEGSTKRLGKLGRLFYFFYDEESLMLYTLSAKLFDAVRMVDFVFMLFMLQTHPYYKGLWLGRGAVVFFSALANGLTHFGVFYIMELLVTGKNALLFMRITSFSAIFLWPLLNTILNYFNYRSSSFWVYVVYILIEMIKSTMNYIMQEGLYEVIKQSSRGKRLDRYKALGYFASDAFKSLCFLIFGLCISKFMKSSRIQKMNPYNYTISFLILCVPTLISWVLLRVGIKEEDDSEDERRKPVHREAGGVNETPFDEGHNGHDGVAEQNGADGELEFNPLFR
jgi:hypothetical protein